LKWYQHISSTPELILDVKGKTVECTPEDLAALQDGRTGKALAQVPEELLA
jgi:hypothetical protein